MRRFAALCLSCLIALAGRAQTLHDLDIVARLEADGSARIVQVWDVTVVSGTEWYIPVENLGSMRIDDFAVSEQGRAFRNVGAWDVDRSLEEKAGRCGIVRKSDGLELCWGVGSYGRHVFTVSYRLDNLVQALTDADAFNHMFVNPGMAAPPRHVRLVLENATGGPEWTYDNTRVWGFGCNGEVYLEEDGRIVAESSEPFDSENSLIVMVRFEQGLFAPLVSRDISFEQMQKKAFKGSAYEEDHSGFSLFLAALAALLGGGIWVFIQKKTGRVWKKKFFGTTKITDWFRDVPLDGSLPAAWFTIKEGSRFGVKQTDRQNLYGAYFLKWVLENKVKAIPDPKKSTRVNLSISPEATFEDPVEQTFFQMVSEAAGGDRILQAKEFENWSRRNATRLEMWPESVSAQGLRYYMGHKLIQQGSTPNDAGRTAARNLIGFKNFLKDFTLSDQRTVAEVGLWKNYLVYAQLFGEADAVAKQFEKLFPAEFQEYTRSYGLDSRMMYQTIRLTNGLSGSMMRGLVAGTAQSAAKGLGGGISLGGGGGFSGGGHGGGSR